MRKTTMIFLMLCLTLSLAGGIFKPKHKQDPNRPAWANDPYLEYRADLYLCSLGVAEDRAEAEQLALSDLRKQFSADPIVSPETEFRYYDLFRPPKTNPRSVMSAAELKTQAEAELYQMRIGKVWTDKQKRTHALAYLDRQVASENVLRALQKDKENLLGWITKALDTTDPWQYYSCIVAATTIDRVIRTRLAQLAIIDLDASRSFDLGYDYENLNDQLRTAARQVRLDLTLEADYENALENALTKLVSGMGFTFSNGDVSEIYAELRIEPIPSEKPQTDLQLSLKLSLYDPRQDLLWEYDFTDKISDPTTEEAYAKAIRTVELKLNTELTGAIDRYVDSLIARLK